MQKRDRGRLANERSLTETLKDKSRRRRAALTQAAETSGSSTPLRNDLTPALELILVPVDELRLYSRKLRTNDLAHVREVAAAIGALGFCAPILIGKGNLMLDGEIRLEAAKFLGLDAIPCIRVDHLTETEQRALRLAINRLGEKGRWNLDELKIEFEELILTDAPIEIAGFTLDEIDLIILGDETDGIEKGPLAPEDRAIAVTRLGDVFQLGSHRVICGSATNPKVLRQLMKGQESARLILTDEPYNVKISGHVTGGAHREFAMASGEMSDDEFLAFNVAWIEVASLYLRDGGVFGTFIDWRGYPTVFAAASKLALTPP